ncbi:hypothetical protein AB3S75_010986 [Citrus x aurantiifolia]
MNMAKEFKSSLIKLDRNLMPTAITSLMSSAQGMEANEWILFLMYLYELILPLPTSQSQHLLNVYLNLMCLPFLHHTMDARSRV